MWAHRTVWRKVVKFGTLIEDSPNIHHSKFVVSYSIPLAPPSVQSFTYIYANNYWTIRARNKQQQKNYISFFPLIPWLMVIRLHPTTSFSILKFFPPKKLLFRISPRRLVRFSSTSNQIIFRSWWQKLSKAFW